VKQISLRIAIGGSTIGDVDGREIGTRDDERIIKCHF